MSNKFDFWADNYTLQQNIHNLPSLELVQRCIDGSVLEKSKTKVLNIRLILDGFIRKDLGDSITQEDEEYIKGIKSIKIMVFKNKANGHQLKVIGVPSVSKVQYCFRVIHSLFSKIIHPVEKRPLKFCLRYDKPKITNIVFGWFLPKQIVDRYFWNFINISEDLKANCIHRPQKFPQLCIKKTTPIDPYTFSCTVSRKGYCTVPGQKDPNTIKMLQTIILKDFLDLENTMWYVGQYPSRGNQEALVTAIRSNKLKLLNSINYEMVYNNCEKKPHKKIFYISNLNPLSKKYTDKTNELRPFYKDDKFLNFHQKIQKKLFVNDNSKIQFDSIV